MSGGKPGGLPSGACYGAKDWWMCSGDCWPSLPAESKNELFLLGGGAHGGEHPQHHLHHLHLWQALLWIMQGMRGMCPQWIESGSNMDGRWMENGEKKYGWTVHGTCRQHEYSMDGTLLDNDGNGWNMYGTWM